MSTIITDRLILRPVTARDAEAIATLADNYKVAVMLSRLPYPYMLEHARSFIAWANDQPADETVFGITLKDMAQTFIGIVSCERRTATEPELGYWLGEPYWGKGYMSEAVKAVITHAFVEAGHERLVSGCRLQNLASRRVLEKAGFEHVGQHEIDSLLLKTKVPGHRFALSRARWQGLEHRIEKCEAVFGQSDA
jgi:RimJ/RimL family protein N-acetyltransferase